MKKKLLIGIIAGAVLLVAIIIGAVLLFGNKGKLEFALNEDGKSYSVVGLGTYSDTDVVIPETYKGKPVTRIADKAFYGLGEFVYGDDGVGHAKPNDCAKITGITIPDSVTSIGNNAFGYCISLTSITISDSVTSIGESAFSYCTSLKNIEIPDSVTSIGRHAFSNCSSLTSITIPDSVTNIGYEAFALCSSLTSITIPDSLTSIGDGAFYCCISLTSIDVDTNNQNYKSIDGNLYSKDGKILIQYAIGKHNTSFIIPDSVTSIGDSAFEDCTSLTSITIPESVTSIGYYSFYYCLSLIEVINKSSLDVGLYNVRFGGFVDGEPKYEKIKRIITDESQSALKTVGDYIFYDDGTEIYFVKYIGSDTEATFPEYDGGKDYEIYKCAFYGNEKIRSVTIPSFITNIGDDAFYSCISLTSINVDPNNEYYKSIDGNLYSKDGKTLIQYATGKQDMSFIIPDSVTRINIRAFEGCTFLESVYFDGTVEEWKNAVIYNSSVIFVGHYESYIVYCTNGQIEKDGTVTYYK